MHLCLIPSHDESRGPSFNRRAKRRRNFILTSQRGPEEFPQAGSGHAAPRRSREPWAELATTWDCCSWPKRCCAPPPHVSAPLGRHPCLLPRRVPSPRPAQEKRLLRAPPAVGWWLPEPCLPPSRRQPVPPQGCPALGGKGAWAGEVCWELLSNLFPVLHRYTELTGTKSWLLAANS